MKDNVGKMIFISDTYGLSMTDIGIIIKEDDKGWEIYSVRTGKKEFRSHYMINVYFEAGYMCYAV